MKHITLLMPQKDFFILIPS